MIWIMILLIGGVMGAGLGVYLLDLKSPRALKFLLAFSAAFLIGISFAHLLPEVYETHSIWIGVCVLLGFLLQLFLELLTKGAEHGHYHEGDHEHDIIKISPLLLMIGLSIHSFLEGMPLVDVFDRHIQHTLLVGILVHKLPIAITLFTLFLHYGMSVKKAFFLLFLFSLMTPAGTVASMFIQHQLGSFTGFFNYSLAIVVGIFLHVATSILYEADESHQYNFQKFFTVILGLAVAVAIAFLGHGHAH